MFALKASTAITWAVFAHDASGDAVTGLTDGSFTKLLSKAGGQLAATTVTLSSIGNGFYSVPLSTAHTDTLGAMTMVFTNAGCKQINTQFRISTRINDDFAYPAVSGRSTQTETDGMVHADLKEWLGAAPAALTASGFVQSMLLRWLTDNAAGTPTALTTNGFLQAMVARWIADTAAGTPSALNNNLVQGDVQRWLNVVPNPLVSQDVPARTKDVYAEGSVWVDTVNGAAGTTSYVNGTQHNPCSTFAAAVTVAGNVGLRRFRMGLNSSITLTSGFDGYAFFGRTWFLALGGQAIPNCYIEGAVVSGVATGATLRMVNCAFTTQTLPGGVEITNSLFLDGVTTVGGAGLFEVDGCYSGASNPLVPPAFDLSTVANTDLQVNHWSGGIEVRNVGNTGVDDVTLNGRGRLLININCTGGTIYVRGLFNVVNNGTSTLVTDANYERDTHIAEHLTGTTMAELPQAIPPASPTPAQAAMLQYMALRNRLQVSTTEKKIHNDALTVVAKKALSDSGTEYQEEEMVAGP